MNILNKITNKGVLLTAVGIGSTVAGVMLMKKASVKAKEIVKEHEAYSALIEECANTNSDTEYSEEDRAKDHLINNIQTTNKLIKNYAVPYSMTVVGGIMTVNGAYRIYRLRRA